MAIHKVLGIETEYGIIVRNAPEQNPIAASSLLVNAYVSAVARAGVGRRISWDFGDEMPANDARGVLEQYVQPPEVETHLVNAVLTNGARFYVDHAHPEYSSPEVGSARDGVVWDRAGEEVLRRAMTAANAVLDAGEELIVYKNNSDGKGNSYGTTSWTATCRSTGSSPGRPRTWSPARCSAAPARWAASCPAATMSPIS